MQVRFDKSQIGVGQSQLSPKESPKKIQKDFSAALASNSKGVPATKTPNAFNAEIKAIALALQSGHLPREEATAKFVDVVAKHRNNPAAFGKHLAEAQKAVTELLDQDPNFLMQLQEQLKKLAKQA